MAQEQRVQHPRLGSGRILKVYMGGHEWEVLFDSGRRFRLPAHEFENTGTLPVDLKPSVSFSNYVFPRPALPDTDQFRARQTIETLRLGVVPVQDVETFTIGLETQTVSLHRALARSRELSGEVMAVIGDYGYGKSHFVELVGRFALRENFIVASASLDLVEVPPSKPFEIYHNLIRSLRYPDHQGRGLRPLLEKALASPAVIREMEGLNSLSYCPLTFTLKVLSECRDIRTREDVMEWIGGQRKSNNLIKTAFKKSFPGIRLPILYSNGNSGRQYSYLLTAISTLASLVGYSGLAVLIDESEHYSLLKSAQRERADSFFKAMICGAMGSEQCQIDIDSVWVDYRAPYPVSFCDSSHLFFLFALTESDNSMPVNDWLAPTQVIRLDDRYIEKDIRLFFSRLMDYHSLAYKYSWENGRYAQVQSHLPAILSRTLSQHRINLRELIRIAVNVCDLLYLHQSYAPEILLQDVSRGLQV